MTTIRVPTPLRPYTDHQREIDAAGDTVGSTLVDLTERFPSLRGHLFDEEGSLRSYVNIFLNDEDIRSLKGVDTPVEKDDTVMIIPSIAGGTDDNGAPMRVDHTALQVNQGTIITLLVAAFIVDFPVLVPIVAMIMILGTFFSKTGFVWFYRGLKKARIVKPKVLKDHPQPHRFAQGFGGLVLIGASLAFLVELSTVGWILAGLVISLAALNLFAGFCVGCALYYWLNRLGIPWFHAEPPEDRLPGLRPKA
jgi:molybdopterin converting factor small subunit